jgi:trans-2,3-dihydro-3-hydroxyanthranilate isomerase
VPDSLPYEVVDVFTATPYTGNPLAVVLDAEGLPDAALQAIAREFNLSETTFPMPSTSGTYRVRIFTPTGELPFAGHPSVGTAHTLARLGRIQPGEVVQECGAGLLPIQVDPAGAVLAGGTPSVGADEVDPGPYLAAVGLTLADLAPYPVRRCSVGLGVLFLPVRAGAVSRARLDLAALAATGLADNLSVFAWDAATATAHTRVFAAAFGVPEDPATGSAALAFGVWLASAGLAAEGTTPYTVRQGAELGRPSTMNGTVTVTGGAVTGTTVGGPVVPVATGRIAIPAF